MIQFSFLVEKNDLIFNLNIIDFCMYIEYIVHYVSYFVLMVNVINI